MYFTLIGRSRKWIPSKASIFISIISLVGISTFGNAQNILDNYSRLSFSAGLENIHGFEMNALPFNLEYYHREQIAPSIGVNYDIYRFEKSTFRIGLRVIRIVEKEYIFFSEEYTRGPRDLVRNVDVSAGSLDYKFELNVGYNYDILNSKKIALYIGAESILGYDQNTNPTILEFYTEYDGFESILEAIHSSPNALYGKLGAETGIKFATPHFLARINFFYHYRLQNMLEGHLVINNSNNELIEREYQLKGDSYGVSLMIYPKKRKKKVQ